MTRVKAGPNKRRKHKKVLKATKGFRMTKSRLYRVAHEALLHAKDYEYIGRKRRKRDFRKLWVQRINIALRNISEEYKYSTFIAGLKKNNIEIDRKMLSELAVNDPKAFENIARSAYK